MKLSSFIGNRVEYLSFIEDGNDYSGKHQKYYLTDVYLREIFSSDPEDVSRGTSVVYFIYGKSKCTDSDGNEVSFPRPTSNDVCIIHPDTEHSQSLRVSEAGYYIGRGEIEYIRLKLR